MKKILFLFLFFSNSSFAQNSEAKKLFYLRADNKLNSIPASFVDSTVKVLKARMIKLGFFNSDVSYNNKQNRLELTTSDSLNADFIRNNLIKANNIFIYEAEDIVDFYEGANELQEKLGTKKDIFADFVKLIKAPESVNSSSFTPYLGILKSTDTARVSELITQMQPYLPAELFFKYKENGDGLYELYGLKNNNMKIFINPLLDTAYYSSKKNVELYFNLKKAGALKFAEITEKNVYKYLAFLVDEKVYSTPRVLSKIEGGKLAISGGIKSEDAKQLMKTLGEGILPIELKLTEPD